MSFHDLCHLFIFFGEVSINIFCSFFIELFVSYYRVVVFLYFSDTKPLPAIYFANIFTQSVTFLFIFLIVSFEEPTFSVPLILAHASLPTATSLIQFFFILG